eukprot:g6027.t1
MLGGQIAASGSIIFGMLWTSFAYITITGFKCKDPASAALGWCDSLKTDPDSAIICGFIFGILFFLVWLAFVYQLFCGDMYDKAVWITFHFGLCSFLLCVIGIPLVIITLWAYGYVPSMKTEYCEAQCTITDFTKQELAASCDGMVRHDPIYGDVCTKRVDSDSGTWSESKCRRILEVSVSNPKETPACRSAFPTDSKELRNVAAVAHASQWVPCFGGGSNPNRVSAFNLERTYKKGGTYSCVFPSGVDGTDTVEMYGKSSDWGNLSTSTTLALVGYCFGDASAGQTCHNRYLALVGYYDFSMGMSVSFLLVGFLLAFLLWAPAVFRHCCKSKKKSDVSGGYLNDDSENDCRKDSYRKFPKPRCPERFWIYNYNAEASSRALQEKRDILWKKYCMESKSQSSPPGRYVDGVWLSPVLSKDRTIFKPLLKGEPDFQIMSKARREQRTDLKSDLDWKSSAYKKCQTLLLLKNKLPPDDGYSTEAVMNDSKRSACSSSNCITGHIDRVHERDLSVQDFITYYEEPRIPIVIAGLADNWKAKEAWSWDNLVARFGDEKIRCGEDDDGSSIRVPLRTFIRYMLNNDDDSPLYVFDPDFADDDEGTHPMGNDYEPPKYFRDDFFRLAGEHRRPPYRWFLLGPERSGSCIHIDPLGTSAWNTLLRGRKLWVVFPPVDVDSRCTARFVKGKEFISPDEDDEAIDYFYRILPRIRKAYPEVPCTQFVQYPGETVFIPGGWWHAVLNLDCTVAVTQNYCSATNFKFVWPKTRCKRPKMSAKMLAKLEKQSETDMVVSAVMSWDDVATYVAKAKSRMTSRDIKRKKYTHVEYIDKESGRSFYLEIATKKTVWSITEKDEEICILSKEDREKAKAEALREEALKWKKVAKLARDMNERDNFILYDPLKRTAADKERSRLKKQRKAEKRERRRKKRMEKWEKDQK